jgi:hypothetical protein
MKYSMKSEHGSSICAHIADGGSVEDKMKVKASKNVTYFASESIIDLKENLKKLDGIFKKIQTLLAWMQLTSKVASIRACGSRNLKMLHRT